VAGTNPLATDMVAAATMGFEPLEVPTFVCAQIAGMTPARLRDIEVRGEGINAVKRPFVRPQIVPWSLAKHFFAMKEI
jgi:hypothetical protein